MRSSMLFFFLFFFPSPGHRVRRQSTALPVWAWNTPGWSADLGLWVLTFCSSSLKSETNKQQQISIAVKCNYAYSLLAM